MMSIITEQSAWSAARASVLTVIIALGVATPLGCSASSESGGGAPPWHVGQGGHAALAPSLADPGVDMGSAVLVRPSQLVPGQSATVVYRGTLAHHEAVHLHYGFNGWNELAGVELAVEDDGTGNDNFYAEIPMAPLADGSGFEADIALPVAARALHLVFRAHDGVDDVWDNNDERDYNRGVPFPYVGPYLTWDQVATPAAGVVVSFATGHPCRGRVEYGLSAALGLATDEAGPPRRIHHVRLVGLASDVEYHYRVRCGHVGPSATHRFRTMGSDLESFEFAVLGDLQDDGESDRLGRVVDELVAHHGSTRFVVLTGDLAWNDRPGLWWTFFDRARELLGSRVAVPVVGNHDTPGVGSSEDVSTFTDWFAPDPSAGIDAVFQVRVGSALLIGLNSERPDDFAVPSGGQSQFVDQALGSAADARWVFAAWHIPPYNAGARHWEQQWTFRELTECFDGRVDWVFSGHEHLYQRHRPLQYSGQLAPSGSYGTGPDDGVGYLVVPPAGAWPNTGLIPHDDPKGYYRDRLAYPVVAAPADDAPSETGFVSVAVDHGGITLRAWGLGTAEQPTAAHIVDEVAYTKP